MKFIFALLFLVSCSTLKDPEIISEPRSSTTSVKKDNSPKKNDRSLPMGKQGPRIEREGYVLQYNTECKIAHWVSYSIASVNLVENVKRTDDFQEDEALKVAQATLEDYKGSGFDRGHLARAHLFTKSKALMSESFRLSNMVPQNPYMNQTGAWAGAEEFEYGMAKRNKQLLVVSGPIVSQNHDTIGESKVCVPDAIFKVIYNPEKRIGIGFIIPNQKTTLPFDSFATSIDEVETVSGIDFFHELDDSIEDDIESTKSLAKWGEVSRQVLAEETHEKVSSAGIIKKSRNNICHDISSRSYFRTKKYQSFDNMSACIASGGRRPR